MKKKKTKRIKVRRQLPSHLTCERVHRPKKGRGSYRRQKPKLPPE